MYSEALDDLNCFVERNRLNTERSFNLRGKIFENLGRIEEASIEYKNADNFKPSYKNMHVIADTFKEFIDNLK